MRFFLAATFALLGLGWEARAGVFSFDFTDADWQNTDWALNGNGIWIDDAGMDAPTKRLRLTSNNTGQTGSAWFKTQIMPKEDWSITITGQFSHAVNGGADNLALVFQTYGTNALPAGNMDFSPTSGTGLGDEYWVINLDSWKNTADTFLDENGMERHSKLGNSFLELNNRLEGAEDQGFDFTLTASYTEATGGLTYTYQRSGFSDVTSTETGYDMALRFPTHDYAYVGFAAATGASAENHDVKTMTLDATAVPEPGSLGLAALFGTASFGAGLRRRFRRRQRPEDKD